MNAIFVALASMLIGVSLGTLVLYKYARRVNMKEQAFKFHELRDGLQMLAIDGKIEKESKLYEFLLFTINLSIKNAGLMKLSELLSLSKAIDSRMSATPVEQIFADIRRHDQEVQQLSADVFDSLAQMLISNDHLIFLLAKISTRIVDGASRNVIKSVARTVLPGHSEALRAALNYRNWGNSLNLQPHQTGV